MKNERVSSRNKRMTSTFVVPEHESMMSAGGTILVSTARGRTILNSSECLAAGKSISYARTWAWLLDFSERQTIEETLNSSASSRVSWLHDVEGTGSSCLDEEKGVHNQKNDKEAERFGDGCHSKKRGRWNLRTQTIKSNKHAAIGRDRCLARKQRGRFFILGLQGKSMHHIWSVW